MEPVALARADGKGGGRELVAFRIAGQDFAIDIMKVREIRGWTPVTPLPESAGYMKGIVNLRGAVLPIIDLALRLGLPTVEPTSRHAIIVVQVKQHIIGLLVEGVSEIMTADESQIQPTPDLGIARSTRSIRGVLPLEGRMVSLLDLDHILPNPADLVPETEINEAAA